MHKPIRQRANMPAKVTLDMVAERAGVSPSTVSRILNGTATVSGDKRAAVDEAIATLGFVPNPVARGLAGGRTLSVGVITQSIDSPFYGAALSGIEQALGAAGYSPLFMSGKWNPTEEARCIDELRSRRVDGLIVLTGRLSDAALRATSRALPIVVTGRLLKATRLYSLDFDNQSGARLATQHLLDLGHRRIAFIAGNLEHADALQRQGGYLQALSEAGLRPDPALQAQGDFTESSGVTAVQRLLALKVPFSAIFAANDQMAFGAALALHRHGLRVPADVSLVGFDDLSASQYTMPPLTTVHNPIQEIGHLAAQAMLSLLADERPAGAVPEPRLVLRESTAAPASKGAR